MRLVEFVPPRQHPLWKLCLQMGITEVVIKVNPQLTDRDDPWRFSTLKSIVDGLGEEGLKVVGLEGDPFDLTPIKRFGEEGITSAMRETALSHYRELLESMSRLGIRLLCYNFMVGPGWTRTGVCEGRGGARATCFSSAASSRVPLILNRDQVWENFAYFIRSVLPTAEECGVRLGLHPDDPCVPELGGYARIFGSVSDFDRAFDICPGPSNAVTFCQANFKLMSPYTGEGERATLWLADVARHFGSRIAFVHMRDVAGDRTDFVELFHDQGSVDQLALVRTYRELGLDVPVRGDHVPEMEGDRRLTADFTPGYSVMGRLFANGYLKALFEFC